MSEAAQGIRPETAPAPGAESVRHVKDAPMGGASPETLRRIAEARQAHPNALGEQIAATRNTERLTPEDFQVWVTGPVGTDL